MIGVGDVRVTRDLATEGEALTQTVDRVRSAPVKAEQAAVEQVDVEQVDVEQVDVVRAITGQVPYRAFTVCVAALLGGHLFVGRAFALLAVPGTPVRVGDLVLVVGVVESFRVASPWRRLLRTSPALVVSLGFVAVCALRSAQDLPWYGFDAVRDSAVWYYASFAFLMAAVATRSPGALPWLLRRYGRVLPAYLVWVPLSAWLADLSSWPDLLVPDRPSVQVAIAVAFLWLAPATGPQDGPAQARLATRTAVWTALGIVDLVCCGLQDGGGFVAGAVVLLIALAGLPAGRRRSVLGTTGVVLAGLAVLATIVDVRIEGVEGWAQPVADRWGTAQTELFRSDAWLSGQGFGPTGGARDVQVDLLLRDGVPGLVGWVLFWLTWCVGLVRWISRRPRGEDRIGALGVWLLAAVAGTLIAVTGYPSVAGPQPLTWLYVFAGVGVTVIRQGRTAVVRIAVPSGPVAAAVGATRSGPPSWLAGFATQFRLARIRTVTGRLGWGIADQFLTSLINFVVSVHVARATGTEGFAAFSIVFATHLLVVNVSRGLASDPFLVRCSGVHPRIRRLLAAECTGAAVMLGALFGAVCVGTGVFLPSSLSGMMVVLGVSLPGLLLQDSWRAYFLASRRGRNAFLNDLVWGVLLIASFRLVPTLGGSPGTATMAAWGVSGGVAALVGVVQARTLPRPHRLRRWLGRYPELGARYLVENLSISGGAQMRSYGVGGIAGLQATGVLKGADLLLGPVYVLITGMGWIAVAEAARSLHHSVARTRLVVSLVSVTGALGTVGWGLLLFLLPDRFGTALLGETWDSASSLLLPTTLAFAGLGALVGPWAGVRALGASRRSLTAQLTSSSAYLFGALTGAAVAGPIGAAWGGAMAATLGVSVWWWHFRRGVAEHLEHSRAAITVPIPLP